MLYFFTFSNQLPHSKFKLNFFFSVSAPGWFHNFKAGCTGDLNRSVRLMSERHIHSSLIIHRHLNNILLIFYIYCLESFSFHFRFVTRALLSFWVWAMERRCISWWAALQLLLCDVDGSIDFKFQRSIESYILILNILFWSYVFVIRRK